MYRCFNELPDEIKKLCENDTTKARNMFTKFINLLEENGDSLVGKYTRSLDKTKIKFGACGHIREMALNDYKKGCRCAECGRKRGQEKRKQTIISSDGNILKTHPNIKDYLVNQLDGYECSSGSGKKVEVKCPICGTKKGIKVPINSLIKGFSCDNALCQNSKSHKQTKFNEQYWTEEMRKKRSREGNPKWKGGITNISQYLFNLCEVQEWMQKTKENVNYTCELTGKTGQMETHHLYAFSSIVKDAHEKQDIKINKQVMDYTNEELILLKKYIIKFHNDYSNAVVLCKEAHRLFHTLYGKGDNTPQQYDDFKKRYLNNEFKNIL